METAAAIHNGMWENGVVEGTEGFVKVCHQKEEARRCAKHANDCQVQQAIGGGGVGACGGGRGVATDGNTAIGRRGIG